MNDLKLDDYTDIDFINELIRDELRCECGNELHYYDDGSLSRCNTCDPDKETKPIGWKNKTSVPKE